MAEVKQIKIDNNTYTCKDATARSSASTANTNIGTISNLSTSAKTNLVAAINEVDTHADSCINTLNPAAEYSPITTGTTGTIVAVKVPRAATGATLRTVSPLGYSSTFDDNVTAMSVLAGCAYFNITNSTHLGLMRQYASIGYITLTYT